MGKARVGCSGWQYRHWRGSFYPADLPMSRWFDYYAQQFHTVEINNTFYRLPEAETFSEWGRRAPAGFTYAVKASRFLTHMKKLKDPEEPIERLFSRMGGLATHLGPVLYQLPPNWRLDAERFEHFLKALPSKVRHVVEFRDTSWYVPEVRSLMERHRVSMCLHDMPGSATGRDRVGPIVYVRFHGTKNKYSGGYSRDRLRSWADWLNEQRAGGHDVYAYFNNDVGAHAPRDALMLDREMRAEADGR